MKKLNKKFIILFLVFIMLLLQMLPSFSSDYGFELYDATDELKDYIENNFDLKLINEMPTIESNFENFDVNELGEIAICFNFVRNRNYIIVYDSSGEFSYGISFVGHGQYAVGWLDGNIAIYSVRGDIIVVVDSFSACLEVKEIQRNSENNNYWRNHVFAKERKTDNVSYKADEHLDGYSRLIKTTSDGQEQVIFENTVGITFFYVVAIAVVCIVLAVFAAFWIVLIKMIIKEMRKNKQQN